MLLKTVEKDLFDYEKVLRLVNLASCGNQAKELFGGLLIGIKADGKWIGEDRRAIEYKDKVDGGEKFFLLPATDYILITGRMHTSAPPKTTVHTEQLIVMRVCDTSSANIANLLKSNSPLEVHLRFDNGGLTPEKAASLKISFKDARLVYFTMLTTKTLPGIPCEILAFSYDKFTLSSSGVARIGAKNVSRHLPWADCELPPS